MSCRDGCCLKSRGMGVRVKNPSHQLSQREGGRKGVRLEEWSNAPFLSSDPGQSRGGRRWPSFDDFPDALRRYTL